MIHNYFNTSRVLGNYVNVNSENTIEQLVAAVVRHSASTGDRILSSDDPLSRLIGFSNENGDMIWQIGVTDCREAQSDAVEPLGDLMQTAYGRRRLAQHISNNTLLQALKEHDAPEETLRSGIAERHPEVIFADGFDAAILGVSHIKGNARVVYDRNECLNILMAREGWSREDSEDYFSYNTEGAYVGPNTPIFMQPWGYA